MRRSIIMLMGAAGLAGCVMDQSPAPGRPGPPPRPRPPVGDTYRAVGTQPDWTLAIGPRTMRYEGESNGRHVIETPTPEARRTANGRRYQTRQLTVDIARTPCSDGVRGRRYSETVRVTTPRGTVRGCGGLADDRPQPSRPGRPGQPGADLAGTSWRVDAIDGRPVRLDRPATIAFTRDRIQGRAGCNSFNGTYQERRDTLIAGRLAVTRMMCQGNAMTVENRFLKILDGPVTMQQRGQTMTLTSRDGSITLRKTSR